MPNNDNSYDSYFAPAVELRREIIQAPLMPLGLGKPELSQEQQERFARIFEQMKRKLGDTLATQDDINPPELNRYSTPPLAPGQRIPSALIPYQPELSQEEQELYERIVEQIKLTNLGNALSLQERCAIATQADINPLDLLIVPEEDFKLEMRDLPTLDRNDKVGVLIKQPKHCRWCGTDIVLLMRDCPKCGKAYPS